MLDWPNAHTAHLPTCGARVLLGISMLPTPYIHSAARQAHLPQSGGEGEQERMLMCGRPITEHMAVGLAMPSLPIMPTCCARLQMVRARYPTPHRL